jgi:hypothetical protein
MVKFNLISLYYSHILVGLSDKDFTSNKQLGATKKSYGYKSDGKIFNGNGTGEEFGPKFEKNDVIGCGIIIPKKQMFLTLNGRYLGFPFPKIEIQLEELYPAVCLQSINEEISSNFTGSALDPFLYDLDGLMADL